ncbi:MAG: MarR family transcriptional regulator [Armatimonadota bacterium]|nr:MarR family transcriptional regulator [Armatimonadota bacterium]
MARAKVMSKSPNGGCSVAQAFMRRMTPQSVQHEDTLPAAAVMCHIYLLDSVLERAANRVVEQHGLTMPQWMALGCIGHAGPEGIPHSELGKRLMLSKAPITGIVDRLERGGYVQRMADKTDRRVSRIVMTAKGEETWRRVRQTLREDAPHYCQDLSAEEIDTLLSLLARVLNRAAQADPILPTFDERRPTEL